MCLRRLARFGELGCVHIERKLKITWASPLHLVLSQAQYGLVRFIHTAIYSVPFRTVPRLEGSMNGCKNLKQS